MFLDKIQNRQNQKWIDLETMRASNLPLVMYGAGINGVLCAKFLQEHSIALDAVCVTEEKHLAGTQQFDGLSVVTLSDIEKKFPAFNCLIGFADIPAAKKNLSQLQNVKNVFVIDNPSVVEDIEYAYVEKHQHEFERTYNLLNDQASRTAFIDFLNIRISGIPLLSGPALEPQYFCDILPLTDNEVFLDCGAYDGDTIFSFYEKTAGKYDHLYAFEPDQKNFSALEKNIATQGLERITLVKKGAWDKPAVLNFSSTVSPASHITQAGANQIEVDSIDNVVGNKKATLIKMDIEGAELAALRGAQKLIAREHPKLAICVYHKADDLLTIPAYCAELLPNSNFYLRRHSCFSLETVFYAIPK